MSRARAAPFKRPSGKLIFDLDHYVAELQLLWKFWGEYLAAK
jgi:hypothetical protein